ncbi:MAG: hypothetical protein Tsb0017_11520 [Geothermobacteraceae bacterium]|nr:MAG: hypothetical protein D6751_09220 [Deltaproteobacteria bacterium]
MKRLLIVAGCLMTLVACAPPSGKAPGRASVEKPVPAAAPVDAATLARGMINLPDAEVPGEGIPVIRYREPALYAPGAVLPRYGKLATLDALAERLKQFPGNRWQVTVRAESAAGAEHAERLAQARADLLKRYLERAGAGALLIGWKAEAGAGPVLELVPQSASPDSSSGVKR